MLDQRDEPALRLLQQIIIGDYNGKQERLAGTRTIALPDNYKLHDLEAFQPERRRFRGGLSTSDLASFVDYVKQHGGEGFIQTDPKLSAKVFFNLGEKDSPGHADWHATLTPQATAAYSALCGINGAKKDQRELVEWIEDWAQAGKLVPIADTEEGNYGPLSKAISAIRAIKIKATNETETTQQNFAATTSVFDQVEASSRHEIPAGFRFTCEPFLGLPSREFALRMSVLTSSKDPVLVLRVVQFEAHKEAIAQDFKGVLLRDLDGAAKLTIGTFAP